MSWSFSVPPTYGADFDAAIDKAAADNLENITRYNPDGVDQVATAVAAVKAIFKSGTVGPTTAHYRANLTGHATPGHRGGSGYSGDMISVSISQAEPPKAG